MAVRLQIDSQTEKSIGTQEWQGKVWKSKKLFLSLDVKIKIKEARDYEEEEIYPQRIQSHLPEDY